MTVRDWLESRSPQPPAALLARVLDALGAAADATESQLPESCLGAARRTLAVIIREQRFTRASAIDLLAVDALVTYAYEHAGTAGSRERIEALAAEGAQMLEHLSEQHV